MLKLAKKVSRYYSFHVVDISNEFICSARKSKVDDYSKFTNDEHKYSNGKAGSKKIKAKDLLTVPDLGHSERALSQTSFKDPRSIENVTDWKKVIKKYYAVIRFAINNLQS